MPSQAEYTWVATKTTTPNSEFSKVPLKNSQILLQINATNIVTNRDSDILD